MRAKAFLATLLLASTAWAQKPVALLAGDSQAGGMSREFSSQARTAGYSPRIHYVIGSTTSQWTSWLSHDMDLYRPELVVVVLGTNDAAMSPEGLARRASAYRKIAEAVSSRGAKLAWIGIPRLHPRLKTADTVKMMIEGAAPNFFDSTRLDIPMQRDGVHATPAGYATWFDEAWLWFDSVDIVSHCGSP
jgi:lysophospholipase L1-like esterase